MFIFILINNNGLQRHKFIHMKNCFKLKLEQRKCRTRRNKKKTKPYRFYRYNKNFAAILQFSVDTKREKSMRLTWHASQLLLSAHSRAFHLTTMGLTNGMDWMLRWHNVFLMAIEIPYIKMSTYFIYCFIFFFISFWLHFPSKFVVGQFIAIKKEIWQIFPP